MALCNMGRLPAGPQEDCVSWCSQVELHVEAEVALPALAGSASSQDLLLAMSAGQGADAVEPTLVAESISNLTGLLPQLVTAQSVQYDAALNIALPGVVPNISVSGCAGVVLSSCSDGRHLSSAHDWCQLL